MKFWYVAIKHNKVSEYLDELAKYMDASASLLVGLETTEKSHRETGGEHIHVAGEISEKQYNLMVDNVLRKKMKLSGRATKDRARQYGQVKDVRNETKMLAYTCKDKNIITKNIPEEDIKKWIEESFPRVHTIDRFKKIITGLEEFVREKEHNNEMYGPKQLEEEVMRLHIENPNEKVLTKAQLRNYVAYYLQIVERNYQKSLHYIINYT